MRSNNLILDIFLLLFIIAIWAFNFLVVAKCLENAPPLLLACLRFALAALPALFLFKRAIGHFTEILAFGLANLLCYGCMNLGMKLKVDSAITSLIVQFQVIFTYLLSIIVLKERVNPVSVVGITIAFLGLSRMVFATANFDVSSSGESGQYYLGIALVISSAFFFGTSNIVSKKASLSGVELIVFGALVPPVPLFLLSMFFEGQEAIQSYFINLSWLDIGGVVYIGIISTILGLGGWSFLIKKYSANLIAPYSILIPILCNIMVWVVGSKWPKFDEIIFLLLTCLGLLIVLLGNIKGGKSCQV